MFKIDLNRSLYYIIYFKSIVIELQYLKSVFKNMRNNVGIWKAIVLGLKDLLHFLKKKTI